MDSPEILSSFVALSSDLLAQGYGVRFRASGGSMRPAICDGDLITVAPVASGSVTAGSVIVYRDRGRLIAHRIVSVDDSAQGAQRRLWLRGDAAPMCDAPVSAAQVLGEVVAVRRGNETAAGRALPDLADRLLRAWRRRVRGR